MDEPPKKRRFWQLHLSTAVILMFVAGGIIGALLKYPYPSTSQSIPIDRWQAVANNVVVVSLITIGGILLMLFIAHTCEWHIRYLEDRKERREGRKP
jgi:cytochrome b subunit of formate dehydrogenase